MMSGRLIPKVRGRIAIYECRSRNSAHLDDESDHVRSAVYADDQHDKLTPKPSARKAFTRTTGQTESGIISAKSG